MASNQTDRGKKRASNVLSAFNLLFLVAALAIVVKIVVLQYFWEPDPQYVDYFRPAKKRDKIEPERGSIIDCNGKLLAMSTPLYNIYMDCCVMKQDYANDKEEGDSKEQLWVDEAKKLAKELPKVLKKDKQTAQYYERLILDGRRTNKRYVSITKGIDHGTLLELKTLPLFEKKSYTSGMIVEKVDTRQYPYKDLARRVIGYVKHNNDTSSRHIGIEGAYDYELHGTAGVEWKRVTDKKVMITNVDSTIVPVIDGKDIRTTLDIDIQDIADKALRKNMARDSNVIAGCVVILDVETAAIKAMVNLQETKSGEIKEVFNLAAGRPAEPGSVFKTVALTTLLEDGNVTLDTEIPTNRGIMSDMPHINKDEYIPRFESRTGKNRISVLEGFEISSNYVFRRHVIDNYGKKPEEFINRLHEYNFGDAYRFELEERGSARPYIPDPESQSWTIYDLASVAIGYSVRVTPLQVATFYNAIANDGKMMKPYIVESIEHNGRVTKEFGPSILNGSICSKATADTLTRALKMVTLEGTAKSLKNAKSVVAGKTGTSRMHLSKEERGGSKDPYADNYGRKKHQATFVGFFPADEPKYTAIVVAYTRLMKGNVYGGSIPALTFKDIADELWAYDESWGRELKSRGEVPQMKADYISIDKKTDMPVPDVKGLGLRDAIYALENNGYICKHQGTGHVVSQSPAAGSKLKKGETVNLVLK